MFVIYSPNAGARFSIRLGSYHLPSPSSCAWLIPGSDDHRWNEIPDFTNEIPDFTDEELELFKLLEQR